ncbi:trichohyalin-like [Procambarus clarkii]|uniref:trichohyalin-like n=1 Tax=Procambarus clarkii TaxID=6728 RepID=UPI0037420BA0
MEEENKLLKIALEEVKVNSNINDYNRLDKHDLATMKLKLELAKLEREQQQEVIHMREREAALKKDEQEREAVLAKEALQLREREAAIRKEEQEREAALKEREAAIRKEKQERETVLLRERERVQLEAKHRHLEMQREHNKNLEMEDERVKKFIESRDEQELEECTKAQLQLVADNFGLRLRSSRVAERRIEIMTQEDASREGPPQVPASVGGNQSDEGSSRGSSGGSKRSMMLELKREEREAHLKQEEREREAQLKQEECEAQLKQEEREAQLKREECEAQLQREEGERQLRREEIKVKKEVEMHLAERRLPSVSARRDDPKVRKRDLPTFDPLEAEAFFDHFERIVTLKEWPEEDWAALVQSRLTGEAREAYNMLDLEECAVYDMIKKVVLQSDRLTPEVYRKCFRECTRASGRSYAKTAQNMERRFLQWLKAEEV